jgi:hypothetical protein
VPVTAATDARARLSTMTQGKHSVNEFVSHFRRLASGIETMHVDDQLFHFQRGLNQKLRERLAELQPSSLDQAINLAVRIGHVAYGSSAASGSGPAAMDLSAMYAGEYDYDYDNGNASSAASEPSLASIQEQLNALMQRNGAAQRGPTQTPKIPGLTEKEVKEHMKAEKCFICHEIGHSIRNCEKRRNGANGRIIWPKK